MKKVAAGFSALGVAGVALLTALSLAGPASAAPKCQVVPRSTLVPHQLTPCDGATVHVGTKLVTFTVYDANSKARRSHPYLDLRTDDTRSHGHLAEDTSGNGIFAQLTPVAGHPGRFSYTARSLDFPSYWLNHAGTYHVQIGQIDDRAGVSEEFYSPIDTIKVG